MKKSEVNCLHLLPVALETVIGSQRWALSQAGSGKGGLVAKEACNWSNSALIDVKKFSRQLLEHCCCENLDVTHFTQIYIYKNIVH
jgi:hypothetical protein